MENKSGAFQTEDIAATDIWAERLFVLLGLAVVFANSFLFIFISRRVCVKIAIKDKHNIVVYLMFVISNDILCGIALFIKGLIRIENQTNVYLCVYTISVLFVLQTVSQGNITCICAQRYFTIKKRSQTKDAETKPKTYHCSPAGKSDRWICLYYLPHTYLNHQRYFRNK